jgi:hypothetical protein
MILVPGGRVDNETIQSKVVVDGEVAKHEVTLIQPHRQLLRVGALAGYRIP